jgi:hypothetical protein
LTIALFFGRNKYDWSQLTIGTRLRERFANLYPWVWQQIQGIKRKDYRHLAHSLQRLEAKTVIHQICKRIDKEMPSAPILTIHDSIITAEPYQSEVETLIQQEFKKLPIQPQLRKELL